MSFSPTSREAAASKAWTQASKKLGFEFTSPYLFTASDGTKVEFVGLVHEFGKPKGTVIGFIGQEDSVVAKELENSGYSCSFFASAPDAECNLNSFQEVLDDWGWQGPRERCPPWYTGKPWS